MTDRLLALDLQSEPAPSPQALPDPPVSDAAPLRDDRAPSPAVCPLCHTTGPAVSSGVLDTGSLWTCGRCGQRWTGQRIATVEAYMRYADARTRG